ncbi:MAG: PAS domain S-box protein [Proteobacteria bacterium]|nr:PAS domain S-box protein [Pseudomonadota bacterium]
MQTPAFTSSLSLTPTSQRKAYALFGLVLVAILGIFVWVSQWVQEEADQERHKTFSDQQYTQAVLIRQSLAGLIESLNAQAESLVTHVLPSFAAETLDYEALHAIFRSANNVFPDLKAMAYFSEDQVLDFLSTPDPDVGKAMRDAAEDWVCGPTPSATARGFVYTPPLLITPEHQFMGLIAYVELQGRTVGTLVLVVDLGSMLTRLAGTLHAHLKGDIYALNSNGIVLYSRDRSMVGSNLLANLKGMGKQSQDMLLNMLALPTGRHICSAPHMAIDTSSCEFMSWESVQMSDQRLIITLLAHGSDIFTYQTRSSRQRLLMGGLLILILTGAIALFFHQRSRQRLEDHNLLLATQLESTPDGVLVMNTEPRPLLWNSHLLRQWKISAAKEREFQRDSLRQISQQLDDPSTFLETFRSLSSAPGPDVRSSTLSLKTGTVLEVNSNSLVDERGNYRGRAWFFHDITKRIQADAALKQSKDLLQSILDNVPSLVYLRDAKSRYVLVNRRYESFFSWKTGSYEGKTPRELLPEAQASSIYLNDAKVIQTRKPYEIEEVLSFKGRQHVMLTRGVPLFDKHNKVSGIVGITTDITARKQIEERLRNAVEEFEAIFENSLVGTLLLKNGRIMSKVNARFAEMFGYQPEELIGRSTRMLHLSEEHYRKFHEEYSSTLNAQEVMKAEYPYRHADGSTFWCQLSGKALDPDLPASGVLWIMDDITDRKKLEQLREDLEQILRHDLKSPLSAIIHVPQLLLDDDNLNSDQRALLHELERSGHRMLEMINRSLDLYKMERGTYRMERKNVELIAVILRVLRELNSQILAKSVEMEILINGKAAGATEFIVSGEELLCHSMLANLLKNAVEASPQGGRITISMVGNGTRTIAIHNAGAVPNEIREIFFEKFATANKSGGTGLGTYSAKLIAEAQGGTIAMHTGEASGTSITVILPGPIKDSFDP